MFQRVGPFPKPPMTILIPELLHCVGAFALRSHGALPTRESPIETRGLWLAAVLIAIDVISEGWIRRRDARLSAGRGPSTR